MQDEQCRNQLQLAASCCNSIREAAASINSGNATESFAVVADPSMIHGQEQPWGGASIPLSILSNGVSIPSQLKKTSVGGIDRSSCESGKISAVSGFTERDYIGLKSTNCSAVAQCANHGGGGASDGRFAAQNLDLECEDTELRLGFGPGCAREQYANAGSRDGSRSSGEGCNAEKICPAMASNLEKVHVHQGPASVARHAKSKNALNSGQESLQLQQIPAANPADKSLTDRNGADTSVQKWSLTERNGGDCSVREAKEKPWSFQQNNLSLLNAHALSLKPINGNLELRTAPRDAPAPTERLSAYDSSAATAQFWQLSRPTEGFRAPSCQEEREAGLIPGRFVIPVPKVSTVPAKRPYFEAINDSRSNYTTETRNDARGNVTGGGNGGHGESSSQVPAGHGLFSWNNVIQIPTGWSIMGMEQPKALFGSMPPTNMSPRAAQAPAQFKVPAPIFKESVVKSPSLPVKQTNIEAQNDDGGSRAPVVGWPPIRSFRKNTLAAAQPKTNADDRHDKSTAEEEPKLASSSSTLFVKAKLDGAPIGRKVDLKSYDSYDSLKLALQEMFRGYVNGSVSSSENGELDLLHSTDYVLTHKDTDGDCMLTGDVPWEMFVTTVKSLLIMKGPDAACLGRTSKIKAQDKTKGKECDYKGGKMNTTKL